MQKVTAEETKNNLPKSSFSGVDVQKLCDLVNAGKLQSGDLDDLTGMRKKPGFVNSNAGFIPTPTTYIRLPPIPANAQLSNYPDGWSECLLSDALKRKVLSTPGFPKPLVHPPETRYQITNSPGGKGLGMFVTVNVKAGDLILSERALLISPVAFASRTPFPTHWTEKQKQAAIFAEVERDIKAQCFDGKMPKEMQQAYLALHNSHKDVGPIIGKKRTNGLELKGIEDPVRYGIEDLGKYSGVFKDVSRINHSCRPNVHTKFVMESFSVQVRALRDIKKGEELFISYIDIQTITQNRQKELEPYGFRCACLACRNPRSDMNLLGVGFAVEGLSHHKLATWILNSRLPDNHLLLTALGTLRSIEADGQQISAYYDKLLRYIYAQYCALGDETRAIEIAQKLYGAVLAKEGGREFTGDWVELVKMNRLWNRRKYIMEEMKDMGMADIWAFTSSKVVRK